VALSESLPVVAGQSSNKAAFVIDFPMRNGREAWAEAATQAVRAGFTTELIAGAAGTTLVLRW